MSVLMNSLHSSPSIPVPISTQVQQISNLVKRLYQADHCLIVFIPRGEAGNEVEVMRSEQGFFYDFNEGQLFSLEVASTIFDDMLYSGDLGSLTFPVTLSSENPLPQGSSPPRSLKRGSLSSENSTNQDTFESVTGL